MRGFVETSPVRNLAHEQSFEFLIKRATKEGDHDLATQLQEKYDEYLTDPAREE